MKALLLIAILIVAGCTSAKRPFDSTSLILQGDAFLQNGSYHNALSAYSEAARNGNADAFVKKGVVLQYLGRYDESLAAFDTAIEKNGGFDAWNNRGSSLFLLGRYNESLEAFDRAISIDPKYPEVYGSKADVLRKLGRDEEALDVYMTAANMSDDIIMSYHNIGSLLASMGKYDEALVYFDKSLNVAPHTETLANKVDLLRIMGRQQEAEETLKRAGNATHSLYGNIHVHTVNNSLPGFG